jgi:hypothetical protein
VSSRTFERGLTIASILDQGIPLREIVEQTGFKSVAQVLDLHLTRLVAQFNLNNNIQDHQIKTIVEDLIEKFPNESLEDFLLCFKMARQNAFGVVYHLHSGVVFEWMGKYLEHKYEELETKLRKEKAAQNSKLMPEDCSGISDHGMEKLKEMQAMIDSLPKKTKMPSMSDADLRKWGAERPPKKAALTAGDTLFTIRGIQVLAATEEEAEKQIATAIRLGHLVEVPDDDQPQNPEEK